MKVTVKRGNKTRLKSAKEAKRDVGKAVQSGRKKTFNYPITETLRWVADGEKLLRQWGAVKSPFAKKVATGFEKILAILETLDEVRKM